jgi:hypothetical protein
MVTRLIASIGDESCIETQVSFAAQQSDVLQKQIAALKALNVPVNVGPDHPQMRQPLKPTLVRTYACVYVLKRLMLTLSCRVIRLTASVGGRSRCSTLRRCLKPCL